MPIIGFDGPDHRPYGLASHGFALDSLVVEEDDFSFPSTTREPAQARFAPPMFILKLTSERINRKARFGAVLVLYIDFIYLPRSKTTKYPCLYRCSLELDQILSLVLV